MAERKDLKSKTLKECIIADLCDNEKPIISNKIESFMKLAIITINGWQWDSKLDLKHCSNEDFLNILGDCWLHSANKSMQNILHGMLQAAFLLHNSSDNEKAVRAILMTVNDLDE